MPFPSLSSRYQFSPGGFGPNPGLGPMPTFGSNQGGLPAVVTPPSAGKPRWLQTAGDIVDIGLDIYGTIWGDKRRPQGGDSSGYPPGYYPAPGDGGQNHGGQVQKSGFPMGTAVVGAAAVVGIALVMSARRKPAK